MGETAQEYFLEAGDRLDDFQKSKETRAQFLCRYTTEQMTLLMCGHVRRHKLHFLIFSSLLPGESEQISGWSHPLQWEAELCVIQGHVSSPISPSLGQLQGPAALGSLVAIPARAWSSAVWRGTGQRASRQACQRGSSISLEQFKLLFLHLTALCQP